MRKTVLITGASSGIGFELVKIFARKNYDLVLVARNESRLYKIKRVIEENSRNRVYVIVKDLSLEGAAKDIYEYVNKKIAAEYFEAAKIGIIGGMPDKKTESTILIITAGTSDIPVAEEAALTAEFLGNKVKRVYDAGVAGIHRLLAHRGDIMSAKVISAIAGMEGALASVVGGLADCPVIAVPTSVGYGASFGGVSALLSMLNSCASGVSVVNIDNGFGAAYTASMINKMGVSE